MRMIDRVAKAMFEHEYMGRSWDNDYDCYAKDSWRKGAVMVLMAMREPSEAMKACAIRFLSEDLDYNEMYRRMIDAALVEMPDQT